MKLLFANKFFFLNGGAELVFFQERNFLLKKGHKIVDFSMVDPRNFSSPFASFFVPNVDYHHTTGFINRIKQGRAFIHSSAAVNSLERLIEQEQPQVAHLHNIYHQLTPSIIPVLKRHGVKVVMTLHDYKLICPSYLALKGQTICTACKGKYFYKPLMHHCQNSRSQELLFSLEAFWHKWRKSYDKVDLFIAPSQFLADFVSQRVPSHKIKIIYNGIDTEEYTPNYTEAQYILYLGRLTYEKGIKVLLEAYSTLTLNNPVPIKVVGSGPLKKALIKAYPDVEYCGYKTGRKLSELMAKAALVVVPSTSYENCSMVILEAMAMGKPVIASNLGGIPEQIDNGITGFLFNPGEVEDLAGKLSILLNDSAMRLAMGKAARKKLERKYSLQDHCQRLLLLYESILR